MADFRLTGKITITEAQIQGKALAKLKNLKIKLDTRSVNEATTKARTLTSALNTAQAQSKQLSQQINKIGKEAKGVKKTTDAVNQLKKGTRDTTKGAKDMVSMFEEIGRRALAFRVAATFINAFTDAVSDAITFLRDFDQILTDIAKISGQNSRELASIGAALLQTAGDLGAVAEDVSGQFRIFVQAGFDAAQALDLARQATIGYQATTLNATQASEILIQTMKVFGEIEAAQVFDKIATAESTAAVTATDLQEAIKRSGATFQAVNATLSETIGLISALQERSRRGGAVVGTAFRTINTRIFAGDTREAVEALGVSVADYAGNLRPLVDVISDLSVRFETLTEKERVQAATTIAGRRQFESFIQILASVDRAQFIAAETADQQGEALKRTELQAKTLNGRLNTLRDTFLKMITGIEEFVPITDIMKAAVSSVEALIGAFDGAIGKAAALSALFIGMKSLVPVFKGLGKVLGGVGGAFPAGLGLAGAFGVGGGGSRAGIQKIDKTGKKAIPVSGTKRLLGATKSLNIASLALGVTMMTLSSQIDESKGQLESVGKDVLKTTGIIATAFAFGPLAGLITTFGLAVSKTASFISTSVDAQSAYSMSLSHFGSETLAGMEEALVHAKAAGDSYTITILEQAIAFNKAQIRIKGGAVGSKVTESIERFIKQIEEVTPGLELTMTDLIDKMVSAVQKGARIDEDTARELVLDKKTMEIILQNGTIFTNRFKGLMVDSLDDLLDAVNQKARDFTPVLSLGPVIFGTKEFLTTQQKLILSLKQADLANDIVAKGIAGTAEARRMQIKQELDSVRQNVNDQQDIFRQAIGRFTDIKGLEGVDVSVIQDAFKEISGRGIELPNIGEAIDKMEKALEDAKVADITDVIATGLNKLVNESFFNVEKALVEVRNKFAEAAEEMRTLDLSETIKTLNDSRVAREREISTANRVNEVISKLEIPGGAGNISATFEELNDSLSKGVSTDALAGLIGVIEDLPNPIAQARRELEMNHKSNLNTIDSLHQRRAGIEEEIKVLNELDPSQKRDIAIKKRTSEAAKISAEIEKARGKTLLDAGKDIKKVRVEEKKAVDNLVKAQRKLIESQRTLADALKDFNEELADTLNENHVNAQENLKEAQMAVMESTESLADAYNQLKVAQLELGDAVSDYRVGVGLAAFQVDVINGTIRGFGAQMAALQTIFGEASDAAGFSSDTYARLRGQLASMSSAASSAGLSFINSGDQMLRITQITEEQRIKLLQESAQKQLDLVQSVIDETLSIGQKFFTTSAADQAGLARGFTALQDVASQFTAGGGFGGIDLNEFGNMLLNLPQSIRQEMIDALGFLPSTATMGGLTKEELEKILFGAAVGESEAVGIEHIAELTDIQVELIKQIAELDQIGILTAEAGLEEAKKQTALAENQLTIDQFALQQAEQNVIEVRSEIKTASNLMAAVQRTGNEMLSADITEANLENLTKRQQEHLARLSMLQSIDINTSTLANAMQGVSEALANVNSAGGVLGAYSGHVPKNFAKGNVREYMGLMRAYSREKRMGPAGSNPVVANDSELIIPTKHRGHMPNYQSGNLDRKLFDTADMERLLEGILQAVVQQSEVRTAVATTPATGPLTQNVEATIQVNSNQRVQIDGVTSVAEAVGQAVRRSLNDQVSPDQISAIEETILEFFSVLKDKGLVNSFGQG